MSDTGATCGISVSGYNTCVLKLKHRLMLDWSDVQIWQFVGHLRLQACAGERCASADSCDLAERRQTVCRTLGTSLRS